MYTVEMRRSKTAPDGNYTSHQLIDHIEEINTNAILDEYLSLRSQVINGKGDPLFIRLSTKRYGYDNMVIGKNQFSRMMQ